MKKIIALSLALIMCLFCLASCKTTEEQKAETVVVGYTIYAPMNYFDENNKLIGFDTELAEAVFTNLGYEVIFQ